MAGQGKHGQPIGKSMKKLHKLLGDAEEAYQKFLGDFDSETDSIKQYAKATLLIELWQRKVDGKKANADDEDSGEPSDFAKSHEGMKKKLAAALNTAIRSTVGENKGPRAAIRLEDADRLRQKADTASAQIMDLLNKVPKNREYCVSLLRKFRINKRAAVPMRMRTQLLAAMRAEPRVWRCPTGRADASGAFALTLTRGLGCVDHLHA